LAGDHAHAEMDATVYSELPAKSVNNYVYR